MFTQGLKGIFFLIVVKKGWAGYNKTRKKETRKWGFGMTEYKYKDHKIVRVSSKRQFTIPKKYFDALKLGDQVKCYQEGRKLVIEPVRQDDFWDFSTDILKELVAENYTGEDLLKQFEARKEKASRSLERLVDEARDDAAAGAGRAAEDVFKELLDDDV